MPEEDAGHRKSCINRKIFKNFSKIKSCEKDPSVVKQKIILQSPLHADGEIVHANKQEAEVITLSTRVKPMQCINGGKWFMLIPYFH